MSQENLGVFHSELIRYLEEEAKLRSALYGFDAKLDPQWAQFQKQLQNLSQLDGLVENYRDLFEERGPIHLEKKLLEACPSIKIYRGLPRLYHRDSAARSRIKREFTDLPLLKKSMAEKIYFKSYEHFSLPSTAKVCFFSWVICDGWGDYIAALEAIKILKEKFSSLEIEWVVLLPSKKAAPPFPSACKTHVVFYEEKCPLSLIERPMLESLRTCDLVIQMPTYYPSTKELQERLKSIESSRPFPSFISIGEYGFLESQWFHPKTLNRSMGLHFLEKGIVIRKNQWRGEALFKDLENKELLHWLFPSDCDQREYLAAHHFYFAYLATPIGGAIYLHALLKAHELSELTIDICSPNLDWFMGCLEGRLIWEETQCHLELYTKEKIYSFGSCNARKKMRIFSPGPLSYKDFHLLMQLSSEFIAIRGDQSFSEAVSLGKSFFYDGKAHARYFMKDLLALAENRLTFYRSSLTIVRKTAAAFLHQLEKEESEWVDESYFQEKEDWQKIALEIGQALQDPKAKLGFHELCRILREEHAFNDFFCHLVQKELYDHRFNPAPDEDEGRQSLGL